MDKNSKREYQDVTDNLRKLRGLSEDEISEEGLLRSRIEQQSELICILKQRADEYLKKYMEIEDRTASIRGGMSETVQKYEDERQDHETLKDRFNTLHNNHIELTKIKDDYKADNERLRKDNEDLKYENENIFSESLNEKDRMIAKLIAETEDFQMKLEEADQRERNVSRQLEEIKQQTDKKLTDLKCSLKEEKANNSSSLQELQDKYSSAQEELTALQGAFMESEQQKKALQEVYEAQQRISKDNEIKFSELKRQLDTEKEKVKSLEQKSKKEIETLSTSSVVRRLGVEIKEANNSKVQLVREFDAYKKHTSTLLNRERELNKRLRRFNIP